MSTGAAAEASTPRSCAVLARAKLNLSLRVLGRDRSGYHQLETVFCLIELADELEIRLGGHDIVLEVHSPPEQLGPPPDLGPVAANLAQRAAVLFRERTAFTEGVRIRLVKRVPHGAGLGGGSSDAAAVLRGLNALCGTALDDAELLQLAAPLGSDVPFFIAGAPLAFAWGRGTRMTTLSPLPAKPVLLAVSEHRIATAEAYAALDAARPAGYAAPAGTVRLCSVHWRELAHEASNDFESVVFDRLPRLAAIRDALQRHGALLARLTGTGSAVFGVYDDAAALQAARTALTPEFPDATFVATATATL